MGKWSENKALGTLKFRGQGQEEKDPAGETEKEQVSCKQKQDGVPHRCQVTKEFQEGGSGQLCPRLLRQTGTAEKAPGVSVTHDEWTML